MPSSLYIEPPLCDNCQLCVEACARCPSHEGHALVHVEPMEAEPARVGAPMVCMHCEDPPCARVCPADAIKVSPDGVVHTARLSHCVGCHGCVLACPFGVPKMKCAIDLMMKCDLCHERVSAGDKPACVTACPTGALRFGSRDAVLAERPGYTAVHQFVFGAQTVRTKVGLLTPAETGAALDVAQALSLPVLEPIKSRKKGGDGE